MKDIMIVYIIIAFVFLLMVGSGLCLVMNRSNYIARIAIGQRDFDDYMFVEPDGCTFRPLDCF